MKSDTFDFKPIFFCLLHLCSLHHLINVLVCFSIEKYRKQSQFEKVRWKFGLVSFFNGISTFVGNLMPKTFSLKNSSGTIKPVAGRIKGFIPFPRVFAQK